MSVISMIQTCLCSGGDLWQDRQRQILFLIGLLPHGGHVWGYMKTSTLREKALFIDVCLKCLCYCTLEWVLRVIQDFVLFLREDCDWWHRHRQAASADSQVSPVHHPPRPHPVQRHHPVQFYQQHDSSQTFRFGNTDNLVSVGRKHRTFPVTGSVGKLWHTSKTLRQKHE